MIRKLVLGAASVGATAAVALLLVFAPVTARETTAAPAIWKIDGPAGDVYLFGSIHILPKGFQWRRPELEAALQQAQRLAFEINMDDAANPASTMPLITQYGFLPPDKTLHKMLAPEHRKRLDEVAASLGLPPAGLARMRPWLAAITLASLSLIKQNSKDGKTIDPSAMTGDLAGVDMQLWKWGKEAGKELGALETTEDQLRIFADLSEDQQVELLVATLGDVSKPQQAVDLLLDAWKRGDTAALDRGLHGEMAKYPALQKAVFYDRHIKWLPQIERMMADGKTHVIIVGAGHLVGKDSVIDMLRAKGVKVEGP
jgi:uncharacterized protein YbaP (TraB family)